MANTISPVVGGSESYIDAIAEASIINGDKVTLLAGTLAKGDAPSVTTRRNGVRVIRLPELSNDAALDGPSTAIPIEMNTALAQHFAANSYDVVFAHLLADVHAKALLRNLGEAPAFYVPHMAAKNLDNPRPRVMRLPGWSGILASSKWHRRWILQFVKPNSPVLVRTPAIEPARFYDSSPAVAMDSLRQGDERIVFLPARLAPVKGQMAFVKALPLLHSSGVNIRLVMTSPGSLSDPAAGTAFQRTLKQQAVALGVADRLSFVDASPQEMPGLLRGADVIGFGTHSGAGAVGETFGIAPVEAMASGRPVVTTVSGGMVDYLRDGVNAVTIKSPNTDVANPTSVADAIRLALALGSQLEAGARATAERYSVASMAIELDEMLTVTSMARSTSLC